MLPQAPQPKPDNSTRVNLLLSLFFHLLIIALLGFFAARQGLLGEQFKKITIQMVKEKPPEKPKEPEKPEAMKLLIQIENKIPCDGLLNESPALTDQLRQ